jgi:hypothetical protein
VVDELVNDVVLIVDEFVTGSSVLALKLLLDDEETDVFEGLMTGIVLLELELELELDPALVLVTMVEEFAVLSSVLELEFGLVTMIEEFTLLDTVLELEIELVTTTDDIIGDTETLELDWLLGFEVVKIVDEFEIGYKTLLELDLLSDPEVGAKLVVPVVGTVVSVVLSLRLETSELDSERLVGTEERVGSDELVNAERLVDTKDRDGPEELGNVEELLDPGRVDDAVLDDTVGLKITSAKIRPEAFLRLCKLKLVKGLHEVVLSSKEAATQVSCPTHCSRHTERSVLIPGKLIAWRLRRLLEAELS